MKITANGKIAEVSDGINILDLLKELNVETPEYVSVEHNGEILDRHEFANTVVSESDTVEFLYYMGGGAR